MCYSGQGKNAFLWTFAGESLQSIELTEGLPHCKDASTNIQGNHHYLYICIIKLTLNFNIGIDTDITCLHWNVRNSELYKHFRLLETR